ncbi:MAG: diguanylate cyclase [Myxococcales bacterium]|nr:diguanylate cyclase [Myxococcales bacterium]MDH5305558.1 diguanylate cyclase [Myxococcales bacterium]MDH5565201.1 diguanylate cyclase [Myxococcales bacterium]
MHEVRVLVIDDDANIHQEVERSLRPHLVNRIDSAYVPGDGIRLAFESPPDVILLDINLPDMDGFKVCRVLKENAATRDVPVLFLTVDTNVIHLARALDCGATDYIRKPVNPIELQARVRVALREKQMVDLLREQARIDPLTGLWNRAALDDALVAAASAHERTGQPVGFLMIDVDHFKEVNDGYGHGVGDQMLRSAGQSIKSSCRPYDIPCRFGGDEFGIIFAQVEGPEAQCAARRLLSRVSNVEVPVGTNSLKLQMSAGLAASDVLRDGFSALDLLKAADSALYRAKHGGRNRLVVLGEDKEDDADD